MCSLFLLCARLLRAVVFHHIQDLFMPELGILETEDRGSGGLENSKQSCREGKTEWPTWIKISFFFFAPPGSPQHLLKYSTQWKRHLRWKACYSGSGIRLLHSTLVQWAAAYPKSDSCEKVRISVLVRPGWRKLQSSAAEVQTNWASSSPKVKQIGLQPQNLLWEFRVIEDPLVTDGVFSFFLFLFCMLKFDISHPCHAKNGPEKFSRNNFFFVRHILLVWYLVWSFCHVEAVSLVKHIFKLQHIINTLYMVPWKQKKKH